MSDQGNLKMILHRGADQKIHLFACRGEGKGCNRNRYRKSVPCDDCFGPLPDTMTLAEVADHIAKGDA